ncbi:hypothetical protein B0H14DRAFT_3570805 [Mycena olivaceomarginata]|nr:hypothetical protein B0H14DRAFT_3570805 [Mycena olivaceomarginata]
MEGVALAGRDRDAVFQGRGAAFSVPHCSPAVTSSLRGEASHTHGSALHSPCVDDSSTLRDGVSWRWGAPSSHLVYDARVNLGPGAGVPYLLASGARTQAARCTTSSLSSAISPAAPTPATGRPRPDSPERSQSQLLLPQGQEILHVQDLCHKHPFLLPPRPLTWCVFIAAPNCRWPPAPPAAATFALARRVHGASTSRVRLARPVQWIPCARIDSFAPTRRLRHEWRALLLSARPPSRSSTYTAPSSARTLLRLRHRQSPHARKRLLSLSSPSAAPSPRCWIYCLSNRARGTLSASTPLAQARRRLSVEYAAAPTATTASLARASVLASPAPARIVRHSHSASAPFFDPAFRAVAAHVLRVATSTRGGHRPRLRRAYVRHGSRPAPTAPGVKAHGAFCSPAPHFNRTLRAASVRAELAHPSRSDTLALGRTTPDAVLALLRSLLVQQGARTIPICAHTVARRRSTSDGPHARASTSSRPTGPRHMWFTPFGCAPLRRTISCLLACAQDGYEEFTSASSFLVRSNGRTKRPLAPGLPAPTRRSRRQCPRTHWLDAHAAYQHMQNWAILRYVCPCHRVDSTSHPVLATQDTTSTADGPPSLGSPMDSMSHPVLAMQDTTSTADDRRRSGALRADPRPVLEPLVRSALQFHAAPRRGEALPRSQPVARAAA